MYSLFVSFQVSERHEGTFEIGIDRFLEHTNSVILAPVQSLSVEIIDCLKSWPCLLMDEGRGTEHAFVTKITAVERTANLVRVTFAKIESGSQIQNSDIWRLREFLGIEQFEFARNHWAIKDKDLLQNLDHAGFNFQESDVACFQQLDLPLVARSTLVSAKRRMSEWGHSDIDDFLLETGVAGLTAGREVGSRRDRANTIVEFAMDNPAATTAENRLFTLIVARAAKSSSYDDFVNGVVEVEEDASDQVRAPDNAMPIAMASRSLNRVFIVHGRNEPARNEVVAFLASVGLEGIVLHDQPNMGRHLLTKFIDEAELVTFAIVLMTADDEGSAVGEQLRPRARQNVILELGYFLAHLGQPKVCALIAPGLETPSDFDGIVYVRMDDGKSWQAELVRELQAAGLPLIDAT